MLRNPPTLLEIGAGVSTKFARRAIRDHGLRTRLISVDPFPLDELDSVCDQLVRQPLEELPDTYFSSITAADMIYFDGTHRAFQNSDATAFFTEYLPALPPGLLIGVHDIFLPDDYQPTWLDRFYSEQYLLACWLLAGDRLRTELPVWHCSRRPDLLALLQPLWDAPNLTGTNIHGGIFWFTPSAATAVLS